MRRETKGGYLGDRREKDQSTDDLKRGRVERGREGIQGKGVRERETEILEPVQG